MKLLKISLILVGTVMYFSTSSRSEPSESSDKWQTDYPIALAQAKKENKAVLLDFTGSDWCPPCMRMKKVVFGSQLFKDYASRHLVLVTVDFPQDITSKPELLRQRMALAKQFGIVDPVTDAPIFPTLVLVNADGTPLAISQGAFFEPAQFIEWARGKLGKAG